MIKEPLTERQTDILNWIRKFMAMNSMAPSIREIGAAFQIGSPNGVLCTLFALEKKGHISGAMMMDGKSLSRRIKVITDCGHPVQCERDGVCQWCQEVDALKIVNSLQRHVEG